MKIHQFILILVLLWPLGCQKKTAEPTTFDDSYKISAHLNDTRDALMVMVDLKHDFHAYAPKEPIGRPVRLEITANNGWTAVGAPIIPPGRHKKLAGLGDSFVLDGHFTIEQKVKPGIGPGKALLFLQVCTETMCDRPRTHEINFSASP